MKRELIVNADDFGLSTGVNRGIIEAHTRGVVTATSLMTRQPAAADAAELSRQYPSLDIGLHVDLGEWVYRNGRWDALYFVVDITDAAAVAVEVERQVTRFRRLLGRDPSHLDSHQHVHRDEPAKSVLADWARRLGVPLRHHGQGIRYAGDFYGQYGHAEPWPAGITPEALVKIIRELPEGVTELCCHPGYGDGLVSPYRDEREVELRSLCDPSVPAAIEETGVTLRAFQIV